MVNRTLGWAFAAGIASAGLLMSGAIAAEGAKAWKAPRTSEGHPDLQGVWTNATITPLERQPQFGDRLTITEAEAQALEKEQADFREEQNKPTDPKLGILDLPKDCGGGFSGVNCG